MTIMDGVRLWLGQALVGVGILAVAVGCCALWAFVVQPIAAWWKARRRNG